MNKRNMDIVTEALHNFQRKAFEKELRQCEDMCVQILRSAIKNRRHNPKAHDFTGNFLNSIRVVRIAGSTARDILGCKSHRIFRASDSVKPPTMNQMSSTRGGGYRRVKESKGKYHMQIKLGTSNNTGLYIFNRDYSWSKTHYEAKIETMNRMSMISADQIAEKVQMENKDNAFEIHILYATAYAEYIETAHQSTGIYDTYDATWDIIQHAF